MKPFLFCILALLGLLPARAQQSMDDHDFDVVKNLDMFNAIYKNLETYYVDTLNASRTVGYGIKAMLHSLDPYTEYYPEEEQKELRMMLTGKYAGIGATIRQNFLLGRVIIDEPLEGMPAAEAGLKKGDAILSVDGEDLTKRSSDYVSNRLRGDAGTSFVLKILRPSTGKEMKIKLTRRAIQNPAVPYYGVQPNGLGYISLTGYTEGSATDFRNAVIEMEKQGMKGLVFDIRGNGGGAEREAVDVVSTFIPRGRLVVSNRGRMEADNEDFRTTMEPVDTLLPVVVLVDDNTASAAEITAGALQDVDRAVIMGTKTYGKGIVQTVMSLPYHGQMKLTTNKYYIPSGRCIQKLTYKHDGAGTTTEVADSLAKTFHTAKGRPVKDAGGIMPDVEVKPDSLPNIVYYLSNVRDSSEVLLNYEVDYIARHPSIAPAADFRLTDADYADFKDRMLKSRFKYDAMSEKLLGKLEDMARFEGYYDGAKAEFDALKTKLRPDMAKDLEYNKEAIKEMIERDLVTAYYYQRGAIENALSRDNQVEAAYDLLLDPDRYKSLLAAPGSSAGKQADAKTTADATAR